MYLLLCGAMVTFMQCGFAMIECGAVRQKHTIFILFKNVLDPCFSMLCFWAFGYSFAFGAPASGAGTGSAFIGTGRYFLRGVEGDGGAPAAHPLAFVFFQMAFAATAVTIVSGAVAERCAVRAFFLYPAFISTIVYPVVVHWVWSQQGFLSRANDGTDAPLLLGVGMIDFAGSSVVHMTGGLAALIGCYMIGPRDGDWKRMRPHSEQNIVLGTLILWFGWYGFNCGSTMEIAGAGAAAVASKVAITTSLSAAAGGITAIFVGRALCREWDVVRACNGILGGLVGVTAGANVVEPG
eukprot:g8073.t1